LRDPADAHRIAGQHRAPGGLPGGQRAGAKVEVAEKDGGRVEHPPQRDGLGLALEVCATFEASGALAQDRLQQGVQPVGRIGEGMRARCRSVRSTAATVPANPSRACASGVPRSEARGGAHLGEAEGDRAAGGSAVAGKVGGKPVAIPNFDGFGGQRSAAAEADGTDGGLVDLDVAEEARGPDGAGRRVARHAGVVGGSHPEGAEIAPTDKGSRQGRRTKCGWDRADSGCADR
jgi:hypothetical protein